jgi:hypothetical protein
MKTRPAPVPAGAVERVRAAAAGFAWWDGVRYCLLVFLAVRIGLTILALAAMGTIDHVVDPVSPPGWPAPPKTGDSWHLAVTAWERADGLWFLRIAGGGYGADDGSAAFFPLYPMAIRGVSWVLGGHPLAAGLLVSNLSFLGALIALYGLTARELSVPAARTAVLLLAVFPTSFFFLAPLSESLFLLLAVGSFWAARRGRWLVAGALGALAAATRIVGIVLVAALAAEAVNQFVDDRRAARRRAAAAAAADEPEVPAATAEETAAVPVLHTPGPATPGERPPGAGRLVRTLACAALPVLGLVGYMAYWAARTGDWLAPFHAEERWMRVKVLPWDTIGRATQQAFDSPGSYPGGYQFVDWLVVMPCLVAGAYVVWRFRPGYALYTWGGLLAPLAFIFEPRALMSDPRFVLPLFPIFWAGAVLIERGRLPKSLVVGVSAAGLGLLTSLFVTGYYIF